MVPSTANTDPNRTAYTITVDAAQGVTTGISAVDRARTCNLLGTDGAKAEDFRRPGHVLPLIARAGGVRERRGHTEAGWEFARLSGIQPEVAVIGELVEETSTHEVVTDKGEGEGKVGRPGYASTGMLRADGCIAFGKKWGIKVCTIEDLVAYVEEKEGPLEIKKP